MTVNVGAIYDPLHVQGLAHFCEHMLHLGTQKYPEENNFLNFIRINGGTYNGETHLDKTQFFFEINSNLLPIAIEIFSDFFKKPLFKKSSIQRVMKRVNLEFDLR